MTKKIDQEQINDDNEKSLEELFRLLNGKNMVIKDAPIEKKTPAPKKQKNIEDTSKPDPKQEGGPGSIVDLLG